MRNNRKKTPRRHPNDLPRHKIFAPDAWKEQVKELNPLNEEGIWPFVDGEFCIRVQDDKNKELRVKCFGDCPVCLVNRSTKTCSRCLSVSYCSPECQKKHWKESHKKACAPNPSFYDIKIKMEPLIALPPQFNEPHELISINQTLGSHGIFT
mmetsp:Transcript_24953/g.40839  ORF Transcript_24953/g.40839 Transcript_24953/m.40839 type:complete len:152 (-) Transcript_24953:673-1128(-)